MKRFILSLVLLTLIFSASVPFGRFVEGALATGGDDLRLHTYVEGTLRYDSIFLEPHEGPGYQYPSASLSLPAGSTVKVLTKAVDRQGNTWVMVDSGNKRVYLLQRDSSGNVLIQCGTSTLPDEPPELYSIWSCDVYFPTELRWGPGESYPTTGFVLNPGDTAWVVLVNGDWALIEYSNVYDDDVGDIPTYHRGWTLFGPLMY